MKIGNLFFCNVSNEKLGKIFLSRKGSSPHLSVHLKCIYSAFVETAKNDGEQVTFIPLNNIRIRFIW